MTGYTGDRSCRRGSVVDSPRVADSADVVNKADVGHAPSREATRNFLLEPLIEAPLQLPRLDRRRKPVVVIEGFSAELSVEPEGE